MLEKILSLKEEEERARQTAGGPFPVREKDVQIILNDCLLLLLT